LYSYGAECGVTWTEPKAKDLRWTNFPKAKP
jgi:hypothetical protein